MRSDLVDISGEDFDVADEALQLVPSGLCSLLGTLLSIGDGAGILTRRKPILQALRALMIDMGR